MRARFSMRETQAAVASEDVGGANHPFRGPARIPCVAVRIGGRRQQRTVSVRAIAASWAVSRRKSAGVVKQHSRLGAVTKYPIHLFRFRYGSLCRFGMSPLNLFFDNGYGTGRPRGPCPRARGAAAGAAGRPGRRAGRDRPPAGTPPHRAAPGPVSRRPPSASAPPSSRPPVPPSCAFTLRAPRDPWTS